MSKQTRVLSKYTYCSNNNLSRIVKPNNRLHMLICLPFGDENKLENINI